MTVHVIRALSVAALVLSAFWFSRAPDFEPVITAIAGLVGVLSAGRVERKQRDAPARTPLVRPVSDRSIAVLPFKDLSPGGDEGFFSDGVAEDIRSHLSQVSSLKVISRTSCSVHRDGEHSLRTIAEALNVQHVLEGSVRRFEERIRIVAQLINAESDLQVWSATFDRELDDVFEIQGEIARSIAGALEAELTTAEKDRLEDTPTENIEAYNLYLLGRHHWNRWTEPDLIRSTELFSEAVERDPRFGLAHCWLGIAWGTVALGYWSIRLRDAFPRGLAAIQRAIELDPNLAEAYAWRGMFSQWFVLDVVSAEGDLRRAVELDPNNASAHDTYAWWLTATGRHDEANREYARARELDPLSTFICTNAALGAYRARDYERAASIFEKAIAIDPNLPVGHGLSSLVHVALRDFDRAIREVELGERLSGGIAAMAAIRAYVLASAGEHEAARAVIDEVEDRRDQENVWDVALAMAHARLGSSAQAFALLDKAVEERTGWITWLGVEPGLDPLRDDERMKDLIRKVGLGPFHGLNGPTA